MNHKILLNEMLLLIMKYYLENFIDMNLKVKFGIYCNHIYQIKGNAQKLGK